MRELLRNVRRGIVCCTLGVLALTGCTATGSGPLLEAKPPTGASGASLEGATTSGASVLALPPLTPAQLGFASEGEAVWRNVRGGPSGEARDQRELRRTERLSESGTFASQTLRLPAGTRGDAGDGTLTLRVVLVQQPDGSVAMRELFNAEEGTTATFEPPLLWVPGVLAPSWRATSRVTLSGGVLARGVGEAEAAGDASMVRSEGLPPRLSVRIALRLLVGSVQVDRQTSLVLELTQDAWTRVLEERTLAVRALGVWVRSERSGWEPVADGGK